MCILIVLVSGSCRSMPQRKRSRLVELFHCCRISTEDLQGRGGAGRNQLQRGTCGPFSTTHTLFGGSKQFFGSLARHNYIISFSPRKPFSCYISIHLFFFLSPQFISFFIFFSTCYSISPFFFVMCDRISLLYFSFTFPHS